MQQYQRHPFLFAPHSKCFIYLCLFFFACKPAEKVAEELIPVADLYQVQQGLDSLVEIYVPDQRVAFGEVSVNIRPDGSHVLEGVTNIEGLKSAIDTFLTKQDLSYKDSMLLVLPSYGLLTNSVANFRAEPRHGAELVTQGLMGQLVRMYMRRGNWVYAQTPDDYLGWVSESSVVPTLGEELRKWKEGDKEIITDQLVFVKDQARQGNIIAELVAGNIVQKIGLSGSQILVELPDKTKGYIPLKVSQSYTNWLEATGDIGDVVSYARDFMGTPYLWGGTSSKGFDCSGFTKTAFYLAGYEIPRDASQQVFIGRDISLDESYSNLLKGDLLFFGRLLGPERREKITHVAFYMGDQMILHASGKVKIESLDPSHPLYAEERHKTLLRARRFIDSELSLKAIGSNDLY